MTNNNAAAPIVLDADNKAIKSLVASIRSAVKSANLYATYVTEHNVTRETVAPHAAALAALAFPAKLGTTPVQKKDGVRTPYGNAVQAAGAGLRRALGPAESDAETVANLLTSDGLSTLAEMLAAPDFSADAVLAAVRAEITRRAKS